MNLENELYDRKLEQKYFYLPKICRKTNNYNRELFDNSNVRKNIFNLIQNERVFDSIFKKDEIISNDKKKINKIKEETISTLLIENRSLPETWTYNKSHHKIMKKILKNEDMKSVVLTNLKNNALKEEYNQKLKDNLPKILNKYKSNGKFEYDNDLLTLASHKRENEINNIKRYKNLNEEYKDMIRKQNIIVEAYRPDSIKENLKNILDYRKKIALRFKYDNDDIMKNNKMNLAIQKSKSQILNSIKNSKYNTVSTSHDNKSLKNIKNTKNPDYMKFRNNSGVFKNSQVKNHIIKEYEEIFMITGMNNKKYKDTIIEENQEKLKEESNRIRNVKKSQSVVYQIIYFNINI